MLALALEMPKEKNNEKSFEDMYMSQFPVLKRIVITFKVPRCDAEDVVQETFIAFLKKKYVDKAEIEDEKAYITQIAINKSRNYIRDHKEIAYEDIDILKEYVDDDLNPLHAAVQTDRAKNIRKIVASLQPIHRNVLILRYVEDRTPEEICRLLGISRPVYYNRLQGLVKNF